MTENPQFDEHERVSRLSTGVTLSQPEDELAHEYEMRYQEPRKLKARPRSYSTLNVTADERLWASVAHASVWITLFGGFLTGGVVVPLSVFIPLVIYLMFRKKSDYVVFHALQAFALQLLATLGVFLLAVVGGIVWVIGLVIAALAILVLAGVILLPLWVILGVALGLLIAVAPLVALLLGTIAAVETYNRRDYRYPFISRWIDQQLAGGFLKSAI